MKPNFFIAAFLAAFAMLAISIVHPKDAHAAPATLNTLSYYNYAPGANNVDMVNWVALPGQPNRTFHQICVYDTSGKTIVLGNGASPAITAQIMIPPTSGASAKMNCYPMGLQYLGASSSIWMKVYSGGTANSGEQIVDFFY